MTRKDVALRCVSRAFESQGDEDCRTNQDKRAEAIQYAVEELKLPPLEATALVDEVLREAVLGE